VDAVEKHGPPARCECGGLVVRDAEPSERRQVFELPVVKPHVTEHQVYSGTCVDCGTRYRGELPAGTPDGMLGPRAMSVVAVLAGVYHQSKRYIAEMLGLLFGLTVSVGTVSNAEARVSRALGEPVEEAEDHVREQPLVHADETGLRMAGKRAWMWLAATPLVAVFFVRFSRGADVAKEMLGGAFRGLLVTDRWAAYSWVDAARRQLCWAHLIRDFTKIAERAGPSERIGKALLEATREVFHHWHHIRDGTLDRATFRILVAPLQHRIEALLEEGAGCGQAKTQGMCKSILALRPALWTFVKTEGVEPTNNFAERLIRPFVLWRKCCFGTHAVRGNEFVERMMTVSATCRLQGRDTIEFVTEAVDSYLRGTRAPSLLPRAHATPLTLAA
jgi:transposase